MEDESYPSHARCIPRHQMTSKQSYLSTLLYHIIEVEWLCDRKKQNHSLFKPQCLHWVFQCAYKHFSTCFTEKTIAKKVLHELISSLETKQPCHFSRMDDECESQIDLTDLCKVIYWLEPFDPCVQHTPCENKDVICVDAINLDRIVNTSDYFDFFMFGRKHLGFDKLTITAYKDKTLLFRFANIAEYMENVENNYQSENERYRCLLDGFYLLCQQHKHFKKAVLLTKNAKLINNKGLWLNALQTIRGRLQHEEQRTVSAQRLSCKKRF